MYFGQTVIGNFKKKCVKDKRHLKVIARLPSVISGKEPCDSCHIRFADDRYDKRPTGMGEKPSDCWVLPLTRDEHIDQHSQGERDFWKSKNIDATAMARVLYGVWDNPDVKNAFDAETLMKIIIWSLRNENSFLTGARSSIDEL